MKTQRREQKTVLADMMDYLGFDGCKQNFQKGRGKHPGKITGGAQTQKPGEAGSLL